MGRFKHGVNGPFVGKVGDVIGSSRYGIPYMKGPYKKRTTNISEKEKFNRIKFAATQAWLKPLTEYLRRGFKGYSATSEGFVSAKSYLHKNALRIENENIIIDPALALLSFGDLPITENAECSLTEPGKITFTWNPGKSGIGYDKDQVMMVAYNIEAKEAYGIFIGQFRSAGQDILPIPKDLKNGSLLHIYLAFVAADRNRQSNSMYLGVVII